MHPASTLHFSTPFIDWHLTTWGNPKGTVLLCLHGLFGSTRDFAPLLPFLRDDLCLIAAGLPTHGESLSRPSLTRQQLLTDLQLLIEHVQPQHLLGYSLGGRLLLPLADGILANNKKSKLFLLASAPGLQSGEDQEQRLQRDQQLMAPWLAGQQDAAAFFDQWYGQELFGDIKCRPVFADMLKTRNALDPHELQHLINETSVAAMPETWHELEHHARQIIYLYGEHDRKYQSLAADLQKRHPQLQTLGIAHSAHALLWSNPAAVAQVINTSI